MENKEQNQEHAHNFPQQQGVYSQRTCSGRPVSQSVPLTTVMFYSDFMKMCKDFSLKFGDKRTGCCITTTHLSHISFSPGNFLTKTI
jgi:hypothetical protein